MRLVSLITVLFIPFLLSGYGYMGELPELGKTTREREAKQPVIQKHSAPVTNPPAIIAPRVSTGYNVNKYSNYLSDIREIEHLLKEIKAILEKKDNPKNKIQHFNAKAFLLNLYVDKFREKYGDSPEKYYESYKQLVFLDNYLKQVGYSNADEAIMPIDTVISAISDARTHGL